MSIRYIFNYIKFVIYGVDKYVDESEEKDEINNDNEYNKYDDVIDLYLILKELYLLMFVECLFKEMGNGLFFEVFLVLEDCFVCWVFIDIIKRKLYVDL